MRFTSILEQTHIIIRSLHDQTRPDSIQGKRIKVKDQDLSRQLDFVLRVPAFFADPVWLPPLLKILEKSLEDIRRTHSFYILLNPYFGQSLWHNVNSKTTTRLFVFLRFKPLKIIVISGLFFLLSSAQHSRLVLLKVTNPASEFRRGVSKYSASSFAKANIDKKI